MADTVIQKIMFLGATVESFDCSFGFNSNPSTAAISLVEDFDATPQPDKFDVDNYDDADLDGQLKAGTGGSSWLGGNPGTFAEFVLPDATGSPFTFRGIVTSWRRTNSGGGRKISVKMEDPRFLFSKIPIITNTDLIYNAQLGSINLAEHNIIDVLGRHGNILHSDWTHDGIGARAVMEAIESHSLSGGGVYTPGFDFYGENYTIVFSTSAPSYFLYRVQPNYRVPMQNTTLSQFLDQVAKDNNFDWYADVDTNKIITIHAIPRVNNADLIFSSDLNNHPAHQFIKSKQDKLMSFQVGRELRKEPNDVIVIGDNRRTTYAVPENNGTQMTVPIFSQSKDGHLVDKMFIPLDNIQAANDSLLGGLPYLSSEKKGMSVNLLPSLVDETTGHEYVPYNRYTRTRTHGPGLVSRPGYLATEEILRAALHSKEAWATTVWYYYYDKGLSGVDFSLYERYDDGLNGRPKPLGAQPHGGSGTISVPIGIAEGMGIYAPEWDRTHADQNPYKARAAGSTFAWSKTEAAQAIREACYQATLKFAQDYYGKVFMTALPYDPLYDGILSGNAGTFYQSNEKRVLPQYEIADGAPALLDLNDTVEATVPYNLKHNENRAFTTSKGLLKPWMAINHDSLMGSGDWNSSFPLYAYASYELFNENKSTKVPENSNGGSHNELLTSGFDFFTSDLSVEHYQFDPRFAIVKLSAPVLLGYGHIRGINVTYETSNPNRGRARTSQQTIECSTQPSEKDTSGSAQAFLSWVYRDFEIQNGLVVPDPNNPSILVPVAVYESGSTKLIDAAFYKKIMYQSSKEFSKKIGFAQRRYIGLAQTKTSGQNVPISHELHTAPVGELAGAINAMTFGIPLKWNYFNYGPFSQWNHTTYGRSPTAIVSEKTINPWNYGSYERMRKAAEVLSDNAQSYVDTLSFLDADIEGYPEINLGYGLAGSGDDDQWAILSSLAGLSLKLGMGGATTQYKFKAFFGLTGKRLKEELDQVYRVDADSATISGKIDIDDIKKEIEKDSGDDKDKTSNPFKNNDQIAGGDDTDVIVGTTGRGKQGQPSVSARTQSVIEEGKESRPGSVGGLDDLYYSSFSEMYHPIATNASWWCEGFVPSINGLPMW